MPLVHPKWPLTLQISYRVITNTLAVQSTQVPIWWTKGPDLVHVQKTHGPCKDGTSGPLGAKAISSNRQRNMLKLIAGDIWYPKVDQWGEDTGWDTEEEYGWACWRRRWGAVRALEGEDLCESLRIRVEGEIKELANAEQASQTDMQP